MNSVLSIPHYISIDYLTTIKVFNDANLNNYYTFILKMAIETTVIGYILIHCSLLLFRILCFN